MIWPILKEKAKEQGLPLSTVVGEVLHLVVLDVLFAMTGSQSICFQGGTSIHLLYGGYRYSEDLDFAGEGIDQQSVLSLIKKSQSEIKKSIIQLLGNGECQWHFPSASESHRIYTYWLNFQPRGMRQKFRVKIEFACYPVYHTKIIAVKSDFDVLQRRPLVTGLTLPELLAEKITAVAGRPYVKGRDIFDLWYLSEVLGETVDSSLVEKKFQDYQISWSKSELKKKLAVIGSQNLAVEMNSFLPQRYRQQLSKDSYEIVRGAALGLMNMVKEILLSKRKKI